MTDLTIPTFLLVTPERAARVRAEVRKLEAADRARKRRVDLAIFRRAKAAKPQKKAPGMCRELRRLGYTAYRMGKISRDEAERIIAGGIAAGKG